MITLENNFKKVIGIEGQKFVHKLENGKVKDGAQGSVYFRAVRE